MVPQHSRQRPTATLDSSSTTTVTSTVEPALGPSSFVTASPSGTLHLRAEAGPSQDTASPSDRRIQWAEDVVNNEGMGKKSSKICCIYHKPRGANESSSEESSSDSSSDSDDNDSGNDGSARPARGVRHNHCHTHRHRHDNHNGSQDQSSTPGKGKAKERAPNAYERVPKTH